MGRAPSPAAHQLPPSLCRDEPRLHPGAFCTGISQMSRGLRVLIKHLENLAGSPLHYPWCLRMLSGVLPLLSLLSELLPSSMSPFAHPRETFSLGPDEETAFPNSAGPGLSFNHQVLYGQHKVVGRASWGRKCRLRGIALLVGPCCIAWSRILECPRSKLHIPAKCSVCSAFPLVWGTACAARQNSSGFSLLAPQRLKTEVHMLWAAFPALCPQAAPKPQASSFARGRPSR